MEPPTCGEWHRSPRDWRSLLPELARMVPWPRGGGGGRSEAQVLQNVLGYLEFLQERVRAARAAAGLPPCGDTAESPSLRDEDDEDEEEEEGQRDTSPWLCQTGPDWEALGAPGGSLSPPRPRGVLGLSPSLLGPPGTPGTPESLLTELFPDAQLSPQDPPGSGVPERSRGGTRGRGQGQGQGQGRGQGQGQGRGQGQGQGQGRPRKRKCVNGFIMFCRVNRREYMSAIPGLTSTAATRDLAQLWRSLDPDERRPYCRRARRFSLQHDRMVRPDRDSDSDGDSDSAATPLRLLLAAHARPGATE